MTTTLLPVRQTMARLAFAAALTLTTAVPAPAAVEDEYAPGGTPALTAWYGTADPAAPLSRADRFGAGAIAYGGDEVLKRAREQLMLGASQLKLAAGGGIAFPYDPIDASQYTEAEFRAAVDAAENWGTYVAVHAYTPRAIQTAIRAGVRCIGHGQLMDEETARALANRGIWLSMQPFLDEDAPGAPTPATAWRRDTTSGPPGARLRCSTPGWPPSRARCSLR
jgi:imidazolonepropionase-like amidohydrolase